VLHSLPRVLMDSEAIKNPRILVVDDDPMLCRQLELYLQKLGRPCRVAATLDEGLTLARVEPFDIVFLDVNLPDASGLDGINTFKATASSPEVIIITSDSDPDGAELAVLNGAWYYMEKPLSYNTIKLILGRVLQFRKHSRNGMQFLVQRAGLIGQDPKFMACLNNVALAAKGGGNVLVTGETGTGKELVARAIHANSGRAGKPFVIVDCTNIPETLAESLLFGHERGAFTDARERRHGMVAQADKGTLFLDEVGDLPMDLQRSLLRVIQEKRFRALGGAKEHEVDVRFVAATNRDIAALVDEGQFRMDLFYRLATFHIKIPPLRERIGDIRPLARHFLDEICQEQGATCKAISTDYMNALEAHDWPGNVRELINVLHASLAVAGPEPVFYPHHLPTEFKAKYFRRVSIASGGGETRHKEAEALPAGLQTGQGHSPGLEVEGQFQGENLPSLKVFREQYYAVLEARYLDWLVSAAEGDVARACRLAGISRSRLYQLLEKHGRSLR